MPFRNLLTIIAAAVISLICYEKAEWNKFAGTVSQVLKLIEVHALEPAPQRQLFEGAMAGMMSQLDEHSQYIPPEHKSKLSESLEQKFAGIGVIVGKDPKTKCLVVISPLVGSPAFHAGLREGDLILEINGNTTTGLSIGESQKHIKGKEGTKVDLQVMRHGSQKPELVSVTRAVIPIESLLGDSRRPDGSWVYTLDENPRLGYVRIVTFGDRTVDELKAAVEGLRGRIDGLIIDLRDNSGGLLTAAVGVADLFLDGGTIVSTRGRGGLLGPESHEIKARPDLSLENSVPIAVLVNHQSASASEIVAACLQDHHRAVVVGQRSWGKGTVQNIINLEGGRSLLKLTVASYWRPSNRNIHRLKDAKETDEWGVRPDPDMEVLVPDEELKKIYRFRNWRDVFRPEGAPPAIQAAKPDTSAGEPDSGGETPDESGIDDVDDVTSRPEAVDDPQLRRAIQYLEKR